MAKQYLRLTEEQYKEYRHRVGHFVTHLHAVTYGNPDIYLQLSWDVFVSLLLNAVDVCEWEDMRGNLATQVESILTILRDEPNEERAVQRIMALGNTKAEGTIN